MALDNVKNFAKVSVSTGYDASATSVVLASGDGAKLPDPTTLNYNCVWYNFSDYPDPSDDPNAEIVRVTGKSSDTLTITRAQEGTSASTKNTSGKTYKMILGLTAKMISDIEAAINAAGGLTYTTLFETENPICNLSSVGDTRVDTAGDTYGESTNQTRMTLSNTRFSQVNAALKAHVSAGTGSFQLWNNTDSTSISVQTTTSTTAINLSSLSSPTPSVNQACKGDAMTIRTKNSGAGNSCTIDGGGMIAGDMVSSTIYTGVNDIALGQLVTGGIISGVKLLFIKLGASDTITARVVHKVQTGAVSQEKAYVVYGGNLTEADVNTVISRTPTVWGFTANNASNGGGIIVEISALSGSFYFAHSVQVKVPNF
jgi:hypothetical protein